MTPPPRLATARPGTFRQLRQKLLQVTGVEAACAATTVWSQVGMAVWREGKNRHGAHRNFPFFFLPSMAGPHNDPQNAKEKDNAHKYLNILF